MESQNAKELEKTLKTPSSKPPTMDRDTFCWTRLLKPH